MLGLIYNDKYRKSLVQLDSFIGPFLAAILINSLLDLISYRFFDHFNSELT